jgi:two-component system KDP operon response regulator KdpE
MSRRKASILVIDDEIAIVRALQRSLTAHGYHVFQAHSGEKAIESLLRHAPDLILLDLELPGMSGFEVCKRVRQESDLPIIAISMKDKERDKVHALDLGADDYVLKPFAINEVLARIRVALRHAARAFPRMEPSFTVGPLQVDFGQRLVNVNGHESQLAPIEYDLLTIFIQHRGKIMTHQMLLTQVWGINDASKSHYLCTSISVTLATKLNQIPFIHAFCSPFLVLAIASTTTMVRASH